MYRIVICTQQWPKITAAGGISRPTFELAKCLVQMGCEVIVLCFRTEKSIKKQDRDEASKLGIVLESIDVSNVEGTSPWWLHMQHEVQEKVEILKPNFVIAQEWMSPLLLLTHLEEAKVISWLHGGTLYDYLGSNRYFDSIYSAMESELEKFQVENSFAVVSPSEFLLKLYKKNGWMIPEKSVTIPYHFPAPINDLDLDGDSDQVILAFIGQLSNRKGFDLFLKAVEDFKKSYPRVRLKAEIYGQSKDYSGNDAVRILREMNIESEYFGVLDSSVLWAQIASKRSVVLCPSRLDNSPNIAYEAIANRTPVVIVGELNGASELHNYSKLVACYKSVSDLDWNQILNMLEIQENYNHEILNQKVTLSWINLFDELTNMVPEIQNERESIAVIVTSHNRPSTVGRALKSVIDQDFKVSEIILVDDGSSNFSAIEDIAKNISSEIKVYRNLSPRGPGFSRNLGVQKSTSEFIAFLDDDNTFRFDHISTGLRKISSSNCDVAVTYLNVVDSKMNSLGRTAIFLGNLLSSLSTVVNTLGDTHMIARRNVFLEYGGFSEIWPNSQEDWAMLLRWQRAGVKISTTGKATVNYYQNVHGIQQSQRSFSSWSDIDNFAPGGTSWIASFGLRKSLSLAQNGHTQVSALRFALNLLKERKFRVFWLGAGLFLKNPGIINRRFSINKES
jgi:glycosyltransferase involved in cell wall biosynthesis